MDSDPIPDAGDALEGVDHYLSVYLAAPGPESIFHSSRHDHAIALWRKQGRAVELVSYWELERLSGVKHHDLALGSMGSNLAVIEELLSEEALTLADISEIWGTPGIATTDVLERRFGSLEFPVHALAHLYSALLVDTDVFRMRPIIALAMDGGPDITLDSESKEFFYIGAFSSNGEIKYRPIESPGPLFLAAQNHFGKAPGTLMALAEACAVDPGIDPAPMAASRTFFGGRGVYADARALLAEVLPRAESAATLYAGTEAGAEFEWDELVASAAMKVLQRVSEIVIERNVESLITESGFEPSLTYLAVAGGVALNCPANSRLMQKFGFAGLLAPPCVDDSGQALGLGLLGFSAMTSESSFDFRLGHPFHGSRRIDRLDALAEIGDGIVDVSELDDAQFYDDITSCPVAWIDGRAELGPRALGHRSILADPRSIDSKSRLNAIKGRQWWRPVAPIVLHDHLGQWFEAARPSPFMLETFQVRHDRRAEVPAIVHLNGSARVQSVAPEDDERLHRTVEGFAKRSGVPMLCNTSLNDRGEPIVASAADAINFCRRKGLAVLYIEGFRVELDPAAPGVPFGPRVRNAALLDDAQQYRRRAWQEWRGSGVSDEALFLMNRFPELRPLVHSETGRARLRQTVNEVAGQDRFAAQFETFMAEFGPESGGSTRRTF